MAAGKAENDLGEPSWELLGRMLEDITFVHVYRRLQFFTVNVKMPFERYKDQFRKAVTLVNEHPYVTIIKSIPYSGEASNQKLAELYEQTKLVDVDAWRLTTRRSWKASNLSPGVAKWGRSVRSFNSGS